MNRIKTAIILSAGFGKRLLPITKNTHKSLIRIGGKPIIQYAIENLIECGIEHIIINTHYMHDQIEEFVSSLKCKVKIDLIYEKEILETGGGIYNIIKKFRNIEEFLIHGGDVLLPTGPHNIQRMIDQWSLSHKNDLLLLLKNIEEKNPIDFHNGDFFLRDEKIYRYEDKAKHDHIYTTIAILHKNVFNDIENKLNGMIEFTKEGVVKFPLSQLLFYYIGNVPEKISGIQMNGDFFEIGNEARMNATIHMNA